VGGHFTILVFSKNSSDVRRYKIPKFVLWSFILVLPPLLVLTVILGINYFRNPRPTDLIAQFQEKNRILKKEIRAFSEKVAGLQNQIVEMRTFDSKLRVIANLENRPTPLFGVGGPFPNDDREQTQSQKAGAVKATTQLPSDLPISQDSLIGEDPRDSESRPRSTKETIPYVPSLWPAQGWVIGEFGVTISSPSDQQKLRHGIQITNSLGTPVVAPAPGLIATIGEDPELGKMVTLRHGHGIVTRYGHLARIAVTPGQKVDRGEMIGDMGQTGHTAGPQLYYEVSVNGIPIDPRNLL
jgi:murein DD-endopeptidase MepM/ murein hydrolase activator NlpD